MKNAILQTSAKDLQLEQTLDILNTQQLHELVETPVLGKYIKRESFIVPETPKQQPIIMGDKSPTEEMKGFKELRKSLQNKVEKLEKSPGIGSPILKGAKQEKAEEVLEQFVQQQEESKQQNNLEGIEDLREQVLKEPENQELNRNNAQNSAIEVIDKNDEVSLIQEESINNNTIPEQPMHQQEPMQQPPTLPPLNNSSTSIKLDSPTHKNSSLSPVNIRSPKVNFGSNKPPLVIKVTDEEIPPWQQGVTRRSLFAPPDYLTSPSHQVIDPITGDYTLEEKIRRLKEKLDTKIPTNV